MAAATHRLRVEGQGEGGWFLARSLDGALPALRLRGVIPGEVVIARTREEDPGWADLVRLESPSPSRREPLCPLAGRCGGCDWQHIDQRGQQRLREERLARVLGAVGIDAGPLLSAVISEGEGFGYRYRARFQIGPPGEGAAAVPIGFHGKGDRKILDVPECPLLAPELAVAYGALRAVLRAEAGGGSDLGDLTGAEIIALPRGEGALVRLNPRDRAPRSWPGIGGRLLEASAGVIAGVGVQPAGRRAAGGSAVGPSNALGWTSRGRPVAAALGGFLQAHLEAAEKLADRVVKLAGAGEGACITELFAGSGLLGWRLAAAGADIAGFERDAGAVEAGGRLPPPPRGRFELEVGDAAGPEARESWGRASVLVADPPRRGLGDLAGELAASGPGVIVLVSCSVRALAVDLPRLMAGGYEITEIVPADLFPQTRHLETITRLTRP